MIKEIKKNIRWMLVWTGISSALGGATYRSLESSIVEAMNNNPPYWMKQKCKR